MGWLVGALLLCAASALWANERDDQYSLAADHYSHSRWKLAAEEFEAFRKAHKARKSSDTSDDGPAGPKGRRSVPEV